MELKILSRVIIMIIITNSINMFKRENPLAKAVINGVKWFLWELK